MKKPEPSPLISLGLLVLRIGAGAMMAIPHGWPKLTGYAERSSNFPDPLGVGSPVSLALVVFAELGCSILVAMGFFTRLACVPVIVTMAVAATVIHGGDPWGDKELAVCYSLLFLVIMITGPGTFSIDGMRSASRRR